MKADFSLKYILAWGLTALACSAFAQNKPEEKKPEPEKKGAITEEIEVVRPYKPVLADAVKIRRSPDLENRKPFKPNLTYNILDKRLELNADIRQLQAQQLAEEKETVFKNNYVKVGAGNFNTGLGEIYLNTGKDPALQAGFYLKHLNQKGDLNSQKFSRQQIGVFGRSIQDKVSLNGEINYNRRSTNFYGYNPDLPLLNPNPQKQRFDVFSLRGEVLKNYKESDDLTYAARADAYLLKSLHDQSERSFALSGYINKAWNQFNFGLNTSLDFTGIKDSTINSSNNIFRANPYVKLQGANYKLILGLNFAQEFGTASSTNLLPAVTAEFAIVPGYATLFAGYTGDVLKTSLFELSTENPYLNNDLLVKNAIEKSNIYGGIKGNAGAGFGYKAAVHYRSIEDMPLFVNNYPKQQEFDVIYDYGTAKVFGFEGEISLNTSESFTWTGRFEANSYKPATEKESWFKPSMQLSSNARFSVNKRLTIDGEILLTGESKALAYSTSPVFEEKVVSVKSFADLSAGAEYTLKNRIGIYLRANNILGDKYQRYLYYPKLGFNILGGFNYSF